MMVNESSEPLSARPQGPEEALAPRLPILVINLDRAGDRMAEIARNAAESGLSIERISGLDGKAVPPAQWVDVDEALFARRTGRGLLPGEYGCYRSHLAALSRMVESGVPAAIIVEDDIVMPPDLIARASAMMETLPSADVLKLVNHRAHGFEPAAVTPRGDRIGRCLWGPQGSAACYLVTRSGARKLLSSLKVMSLPFDVALERGWETGAETYVSETDLVGFGDLRAATMIGTRADYRAVKPARWRRLPAQLFQLGEILARRRYARAMPKKAG